MLGYFDVLLCPSKHTATGVHLFFFLTLFTRGAQHTSQVKATTESRESKKCFPSELSHSSLGIQRELLGNKQTNEETKSDDFGNENYIGGKKNKKKRNSDDLRSRSPCRTGNGSSQEVPALSWHGVHPLSTSDKVRGELSTSIDRKGFAVDICTTIQIIWV